MRTLDHDPAEPGPGIAAELDSAALRDLLSDADGAEAQAVAGPFYPDRGITAESLLAYARECRDKAERFKSGGAHAAVLHGWPAGEPAP